MKSCYNHRASLRDSVTQVKGQHDAFILLLCKQQLIVKVKPLHHVGELKILNSSAP